MAVMFIIHDMGVVAKVADQVVVIESGSVDQVFHAPVQAYAKRLLKASMGRDDAPHRRGTAISDEVLIETHWLCLSFPSEKKILCKRVHGVQAGGQHLPTFDFTAEKYNTLAYATRYGFSVETEGRSFPNGPFDNMLAFLEDGELAAVRCRETMARIGSAIDVPLWLQTGLAPPRRFSGGNHPSVECSG